MARKVIGPTGSRRRRWVFVVTALAAIASAAFFISAAGAVTGSPSGFESSDGDMVLTTTGGGHTDWNCFAGPGNSGGFSTSTDFSSHTGCAKTTGASQVTADANGEVQWVNGQKFDTQCPALNTGNSPPKDDFTNIAEYDELAGNGDLFFYGAAIRSTANGNTSGDVEFNQVAGNGTTSAGCRTPGDRLVAYDYLNGGTSLDFHVLTWIDSSHSTLGGNSGKCLVKTDSMPCWGANVITPDGSLFDGQANQGAIPANQNGMNHAALVAQQFAEFGVNLTQALGGGPLPCFPQQVWESRSSGSSFTSNPEDIEFAHVSTCGSITIIKNTDPRHVNQNFGFTASGGSISPSAFKLNDRNALSVSGIGTGTATSTITTATPNGFTTGDKVGVTISGSNSTPSVDGNYTATITGASTFTIPLNAAVTAAGTAGSVSFTTEVYPQISAGTYVVNEPSEPSGFSFESLTCVDSGGSSTVKSGAQATISVAANGSTTCTYVNKQNSATIATQQSSSTGTVFPGTGVTDTATVTGSNTTENPSGTVDFFLCGPLASASGCTSSDSTNVAAGSGSLSGSGGVSTATSSPAVNTSGSPLAAGIYCFEATWAGDTNYPGALDATSSTHECFTVSTISTTVVTTPSVGQNGSTTFGNTTVTDSATITAAQAGGGAITGSVTFFICNPSQLTSGTCSTGGTQVGSPVTNLVDQGVSPPKAVAVSAAFTNSGNGVNQTGTWCWRAVYTPGGANGSNYTGNSDSSSTECFTVGDTTSGTSAQTWLPNDSATVAAAHGAPLNGTLSIQLYTGDSCGVSGGTAVNGQEYHKTLNNATTASDRTVSSNNTTYAVSTTTSVSWLVTFTSSDSNVSGSTHCEKSTVTITN